MSRASVIALLAACGVAQGGVILTPTADAYAQSNNSGPYGASTILALKYGEVNWPYDYHRKAWIRFDLSNLTVRDFSGASLDLPFVESSLGTDATGNWTFSVYGLTDQTLDGWSEASMRWNDPAPANITNSGFAVDGTKATLLGNFTVSGKGFTGSSTIWTISGTALENFLAADTNNLATFIVCRDTQAPSATVNYAHAIASKEHATVAPSALKLPNAAAAPPRAHEGFSYPTGDLNTRNGGTGWANAWTATTANEEVRQPAIPLQYSIPGGGVVDGGDRTLAIIGNGDPTLATRSLQGSFNGTDVYISFLLRWAAGTVDQNDFVAIYFGSSSGPSIGVKGNMDTGVPSNPDFFVRTTSANNTYFGNISDNTTTFFIVGHLFKSGSANFNRYELWVNPDYGDAGSPDAVSTLVDSGLSSFNLIGLRSVNLDSGEVVYIDELRLGTSWSDVVLAYVPEPATMLVLASGLLALARRRARSR